MTQMQSNVCEQTHVLFVDTPCWNSCEQWLSKKDDLDSNVMGEGWEPIILRMDLLLISYLFCSI